jgi:Arc/MetJ family transcription regulator
MLNLLATGGCVMHTRTNIVIDDTVIKEARKLTLLKTKKEIIDLALRELVSGLKRKRLLDLRHKGLWEGNLKQSRRTRVDTD